MHPPMRPEFTPSAAAVAGCALCEAAGGVLLWTGGSWRVVRVADPSFPAYYRVVSNHHVGEFSALPDSERLACMALVCAVERVLLEQLLPTKINLAALGNMVPHLHWHVVARFDWDSHFPQPIWGPKQREVLPPACERLRIEPAELDELVIAAVAAAS